MSKYAFCVASDRGIPMKKMEEFPETEKCDCQLASKQSPEITADSGKRNQKENALECEKGTTD